MQDQGHIRLTHREFTQVAGVLRAIKHDQEAALEVHEEGDMDGAEAVVEALRQDMRLVQAGLDALSAAERRGK